MTRTPSPRRNPARSTLTDLGHGIFRIAAAHTNCYLVKRDDGITLVDAGLPGMRPALDHLLRHVGARREDIDGVLLTHGHFDHVGMAKGLERPVLVHPRDRRLARHPYSYRPARARVPYLVGHPSGIPFVGAMALRGALGVRGVDARGEVVHDRPVDVPGAPVALWTPGHTDGHCAFFFPSEGVLIAGDALVTLDPYTGARGPQIVADAATADAEEALRSLDTLERTGATLVLTGHGEPWRDGVGAAVAEARRTGQH